MSHPTVRLTHSEYERIKSDLIATYGKRILISFVCKRELGFTFREHRTYRPGIKTDDWRDVHSEWVVDFYDDQAETMFRLKYL